jgi:polyribonucleotide nucleotidyltransferase
MKKENREIVREFSFEGSTCSLSTGKIAQRSDGSVVARMGDTIVLATANVGNPLEGANFFPLSVEYIERMYAGGLISSSRFVKRERFPSTEATLAARMIDRSIRSRFPDDYRNEVQVVLTILSYDPDHDPLIIGFTAVSAALMMSAAPFNGPIAGIRVGHDGENPVIRLDDVGVNDHMDDTSMNFILSTDGDVVTMIDADAKEVSEDTVVAGMEFGVSSAKTFIDEQKAFISEVEKEFGKTVKPEYESYSVPKDLLSKVRKEKKKAITAALEGEDREIRKEGLTQVKEELFDEFEGKYTKNQMSEAVEYVAKEIVRDWILSDKRRMDGRALDEIREIAIEVEVLPRAHGSALFTRGGTQTLSVTTLASGRLEQIIEGMEGEDTRRYMHHYNAPDFSVGEAGRYMYIPKRREIGHGALAEKALEPVIPDQEVFPYTIRVVSEIMSQSGSSSMAAVCGSTLALMDAGVPITKPVAGIAMGVVTSDDLKDYVILTDIFEQEDFFGDMDFKVAGTRDGITAIQMDNKRSGLPVEIFKEALKGAQDARLSLIEKIEAVIDTPRTQMSKYAPKIDIVRIPVDKIGELIGPGGKVIKGIIERTGADINVEDDGKVTISSTDEESRKQAVKIIEDMFEEAEIGRVYSGEVTRIEDFGVFVEVAPAITGLVHVSEMSDSFVKDPRALVKMGETVKVKVTGVDERGRVQMSMKAVNGGGSGKEGSNKESKEA